MDFPISQVQFLAFDFETTGLNSSADRIIEIGAVRFTVKECISEFHSLANPGRMIPEAAQRIHGISTQDVVHARPVAEVIQDFHRFVGDAVLVAHNVHFDFLFLQSELRRRDKNIVVSNTLVDTVSLAQKAFPRLKSYKLEALVEALQLTSRRAHSALDDAYSCKDVFLRATHELSFFGELTLADCV